MKMDKKFYVTPEMEEVKIEGQMVLQVMNTSDITITDEIVEDPDD